jgi:hypothetical protein
MIIDPLPFGKKYAEYTRSDRLERIRIPRSSALAHFSDAISEARAAQSIDALREACGDFLKTLSDFYDVKPPTVKVLAGARPHKTLEGRLVGQLFGDYHRKRAVIRLWARTAMKKQWTTAGTLLSTLCHEFAHHLDVTGLGFPTTFHTVGFYERTHRLYLAATGCPYYRLVWYQNFFDRERPWVMDWPETNRRRAKALARMKEKRPRT